MPHYDVIVIGAGVNGLTAAAILARTGRRVMVLEARDRAGGLASSEEFHPGCSNPGFFQDTGLVQRSLVEDLGLETHGLRWREDPPDVLAIGEPGETLLLPGNPALSAQKLEWHNERDEAAFFRFTAFLRNLRPLVSSWMTEPPLDPTDDSSFRAGVLLRRGLRLRRLGRRALLDLLRLPPLSIADGLGEWFENDLLRAALAIPALGGTWMGPRSPGGYTLLLRHWAARGAGIQGNGPALVDALERATRSFGGTIRLGARVEALHVDGRVRGVTLADGERLDADTIAASCHPQTLFLSLLSPQVLPARLARQIGSFRSRGTTAQVLLALRTPLRFKGYGDRAIEFARIGAGLDAVERAFDAVKYGQIARRPVLEVHCPVGSTDLPEPQGHAVASILAHFVPYSLEHPWSKETRRVVMERVLEVLAPHVESLEVVASELLAPPDLESRYLLPGGHAHHGEHALDQLLLRPAPRCASYATPIPGLFLCGSGSHPGGGLTCAPGALAARTILAA